MKKAIGYFSVFILSSVAATGFAADWDGVPIPAPAGAGKTWQLQSISDEFNYAASPTFKPTEFNSRWVPSFINSWTGPGDSEFNAGHSYTSGGSLALQSSAKAGTNKIYTGIISSKETFTYPLYLEARVKHTGNTLANAVWMLSADSTQEIDAMESYGSDRAGQEWFDQRMHVSHHVFIRSPFQDYQPKDEGSWVVNPAGGTWRGAMHVYGVHWKDPWNLDYYIDGVKVRTVSGPAMIDPYNFTNGTGINKPLHIIIDVEHQDWRDVRPTAAELADTSKSIMFVDWIRVYKPVTSSATSSSNSVSSSSSSLSNSSSSSATTVIDFANYFDTGKSTASVAGDTYVGFNKSGSGNINYNTAGDWADYLVTLPSDGQYNIEVTTASPMTSGIGAKLSIDGIYVSTTSLAATGGWELYSASTLANNLSIGAGTHTVRIESTGTSAWQWNGDEIRVTKVGSAAVGSPTTPAPVAMIIQAESFSATGGVYDGFKTYSVNGVSAINYNQRGDWADYAINVAADGSYTFNAYVSSPMSGAALEVSVDGVKVLTQAVPNNGSWDSFQKVSSVSKIALTKGAHTIRVTSAGATSSTWEWNADKFELVP
ncbi:putative agarase [Cellvibrio sp. BR]|uniref:carbohydrate-binding protein n=1 Tax=Cellvibrio sp. BR TaxID=1134474 RepID=UPI000260164C|nr:carbohydrate-binding protein [Cellvibrio sp. BR]EIK45872.1 putative agarase [Cellvibrio sp. BR]